MSSPSVNQSPANQASGSNPNKDKETKEKENNADDTFDQVSQLLQMTFSWSNIKHLKIYFMYSLMKKILTFNMEQLLLDAKDCSVKS